MRKFMTKLSAMLLSAALLITMVPAAVFAEEYYDDFADGYFEGDYPVDDFYPDDGGYTEDPWAGDVYEDAVPVEEEVIPEPAVQKEILELNGYRYTDLTTAVAAVRDQDTLKVIDDFYLSNPVSIEWTWNVTLTLDLNGHTIYLLDPQESADQDQSGAEGTSMGGLLVLRNGTLVIQDSSAKEDPYGQGKGQIVSTNKANPAIVMIQDDYIGNYLQIEGGTFRSADGQKLIEIRDFYDNPLPDAAAAGSMLSVRISGGYFREEQPSDFMEFGYGMQNRGDGTWEVTAVTPEEPEVPVYEPEEPVVPVYEPEEPVVPVYEPEEPVVPIYEPEEPVVPVYEPDTPAVPVNYTINWVDDEGNWLETDIVEAGSMPVFYAGTPVKAGEGNTTYDFMGWSPVVEPAASDMTYTAVFIAVWDNYNSEPEEPTAPEEPVLPEEPETEPEGQSEEPESPLEPVPVPEPEPASEEEDITAFTGPWHITWTGEDGTVVYAEEYVEEGEIPFYPIGIDYPKKDADEENIYEFSGWDPEVTAVKEDTVYRAVFAAIPKTTAYTITWKNYNDEILAETSVNAGEIPVYPEDLPEPYREEDPQYIYLFDGWDPQPAEALGDATFRASFLPQEKTEFIIRWRNWDDTLLLEDVAGVGEMPQYTGATPEKEEDESYVYTFDGWDPEVMPADADMDYAAVFHAEPKEKQYEIDWQNWDGTWLETDYVKEGETPVYAGMEPQRPADEQNTYTFAGWNPQITAAAQDAVYTALYDANPRPVQEQYQVTWQNYDYTALQSDLVKEGDQAVYTGETPRRESDAKYDYIFAGWNPQPGEIYSDTIYTATYHAVKKPVKDTYVVVWQNWDHTILEVDTVKVGNRPVYYGPFPYRAPDLYYRYVFSYWSEYITPVTGNRVYTAVYYPVLKERTYTIIWQNWDNSVIYSTEVKEGCYPQYYGYTPVRPADGQYSYVFTGWKQPVVRAYSDMVYTAVYQAIPIVTQYTITWKNYDGTLLRTDTVNNGQVPAYTGTAPQRTPDGKYTYQFIGWDKEVTAAESDAVYIAQFRQIPAMTKAVRNLYTLTSADLTQDYPVAFETGDSEIPYIELSRGFETLSSLLQERSGEKDRTFEPVYNQEGESLIFTATGSDGSQVMIDLGRNTVQFTDYTGFSDYSPSLFSKDGRIQEAQVTRMYPVSDSGVTIALDDYGINVYALDGAGYMPLATFADLFLTPAGFNWLYNGKDLFLTEESLDDTVRNENGQTLKEIYQAAIEAAQAAMAAQTANEGQANAGQAAAGLQGKGETPLLRQRSQKLAEFSYQELCLLLDLNFGMKKDLNINNGFDAFFRETGMYPNLVSTNGAAYESALRRLSSDYFANAVSSGRQNGYEEVDNTAYITIARFQNTGLDLASREVRDNLENYITEDTAALVIYANQQINRLNSPVKNVVIDISNSCGSDLQSALFTIGWVLGSADIYTEDVLSGDHELRSFRTDINLDGQTVEADHIDRNRFHIFCLISSGTRDYGNLMASAFKTSDLVTIVGQTTGGGAHDIRNVITPSGSSLSFAGLQEFCTFKAGAYISIASGIDADVYLKDISVFNNRYKLGAILDEIR